MKKRLITSALPYVNNIPHLGNLIQVLSADVFARYCRLAGYETLYICGTDEYGTATETRAREEGITPRELCDRYFAVHDEIYRWFNIAFDKFGRTSTPEQTEIVQDIFLKLWNKGYINEHEIEQLYSEESQMYLADRYVRGTCPNCGYEEARGDQCENCGKLLDPADLINPRSALDNSTPVLKKTTHLYIDLPAILPKLQEWMDEASEKGRWARNALQMTHAWIRDGLKERGITRDLKWGIPVPLEKYQDKVFYVWFDAPIGYISITATHTSDWKSWWKNPQEVELFQFIGKDNIPFHTVIFPSSLIGSGDTWTLLHHMSSTEYLNYESGKFSKSAGIGVFGNDAQDTGIPADVWRFYMFYNRPETSDYTFTWNDFQEKTNGELIGNLANLVNRSLTFLDRYFDGTVVEPGSLEGVAVSEADAGAVAREANAETPASKAAGVDFWLEVRKREEEITSHLEQAQLRDAFRKAFALSSFGNRVFQAAEPWNMRKTDPDATQSLLRDLVYLVRDLAILIQPYTPDTSARISGLLGNPPMNWADLGRLEGIRRIEKPAILFETLSDELIESLRSRFAGSQAERAGAEAGAAADQGKVPVEERFQAKVKLTVAKIIGIERHPKADKLYIEKIDDGSGGERQIVSGLVPYYKEEELLGHNIVLVDNLKPAKLRGVKSEGMLLAADATISTEEGEQEVVEVIFADEAEPGDRVTLAGVAPESVPADPGRIDVDTFFSIPLRVEGGTVLAGDTAISCAGKVLKTERIQSGSVG